MQVADTACIRDSPSAGRYKTMRNYTGHAANCWKLLLKNHIIKIHGKTWGEKWGENVKACLIVNNLAILESDSRKATHVPELWNLRVFLRGGFCHDLLGSHIQHQTGDGSWVNPSCVGSDLRKPGKKTWKKLGIAAANTGVHADPSTFLSSATVCHSSSKHAPESTRNFAITEA